MIKTTANIGVDIMTSLFFQCMVLLLLLGCNNTGSTKQTSLKRINDSAIVVKSDTITATQRAALVLTRVDSIDIANSNEIAADDETYLQKATVLKNDSSIWLTANMKLDHRIFGYDMPDTTSAKMILFYFYK